MDENIRKGIEQSEYFLAIIGECYYDDPDCIEQFLYAKNLGKPMILYIKKGINEIITDLFKNCDIKLAIMFDDIKDIEKSKGKLFTILNSNG